MFKMRIILWVLAIWCSWSGSVLADDNGEMGGATAETEDAARAAFGDATDLYNDGKYDESLKMFQKAYNLKPSWKLYYNIGQAALAAKRQGVAIAAFEKYLTEGGDEIPMTRRDEVLIEVERLRPIVGAIDLKAPDGFSVVIDGFPRGTTPLVGRLRVAASQEHLVDLKDGDRLVESRKIIVGGQETVTVSLGQGNASGTVALSGDNSEMTDVARNAYLRSYKRKSRNFRIAGWVSLGTGGALATLGLLGAAAAKSQKRDNDDTDCAGDPDPNCETKLEKSIQDQEDLRSGSIGVFVIGVAALIASPFLFKASKKNETRARQLESAFLPQLSPGYSGFTYQIRF